MTWDIDLAKAPNIGRGHVFLQLDTQHEQALVSHWELLDRIKNSLSFTRQIDGEHAPAFRAALIRATLAELVSLEDVQKTLLAAGRLMHDPLRLNASGNPLLCITRELRNVEIHLSSSEIASEKRDLLWGNAESPAEATPVNWSICWIDNIELSTFQRLNNYKFYDSVNFEKALAWFDSAQREWGITEILYRTTCTYASDLVDYHRLRM